MAQLVIAKNANGIALAADGKELDFSITGEIREQKVNHLIQLGKSAAILAGGAPDSVAMAEALKSFIAEEGLSDIKDIYAAALPLLASEYDRYMRKSCELLPVDPLRHVYFILAGYSPSAGADQFHAYLIWTKKKLPQLDGDEIEVAYSVPRRITLELKLNKLCKGNASLDELLAEAKAGLLKLGEQQEEIGPPYQFAAIDAKGVALTS